MAQVNNIVACKNFTESRGKPFRKNYFKDQ